MNCKNKSFMTKRKAFTLIELLIVIAIIGILFIVLVSKVDFATDKAKASGVQTDFRSFQMAFDTVAKENAGFNTFGWDTGDTNANGKRDSYDEGDNGAGGGIAKNGIQDGTEVFTGHKVYAETFTKVYSLVKPGTTGYDRDALNRLETAINANLDPKLHITIKDDGEIVMANGAKDPWSKEYHGYYISNAENDGKDRGAIVMYSDGANNKFGSEHSISNGVVSITIPGSNKNGKDDYSIVSVYTYLNGYGEVLNMTTGFSNNQNLLSNSGAGSNVVVPGEAETPANPGEPINEYGFYFNVPYVGIYADMQLVFYMDGSINIYQNDEVVDGVPAGTCSYELNSVYLDDELIASFENNGINMTFMDNDFILKTNLLSFDSVDYVITKDSINNNVSFHVNCNANVKQVLLNGSLVNTSDYTVTGNTTVTFKEDFINALSNGKYSIQVIFDDGSMAISYDVITKIKYTTKEITIKIGTTYGFTCEPGHGVVGMFDEYWEIYGIDECTCYLTAIKVGYCEVVSTLETEVITYKVTITN